jgi:sRNA-binding regulator protein Hfq
VGPQFEVSAGDVMKETTPALAGERVVDNDAFASRKLIRPLLNHTNHSNHSGPNHPVQNGGERRDRPERSERSQDRSNGARKAPPPDQTNAENFYYQKQMQSKTSMVIVLTDGEEVHGCIEWYDKACIKVNRTSGPNLMIYKPSIKYIYKEGEGRK